MRIRKAAVVGKDGRTSAIQQLLRESRRITDGVPSLSSGKGLDVVREVIEAAKRERPDFVAFGPEEPLAFGAVDALQTELQIPSVGPTRKLAQLEASKSFTRNLVRKYGLSGDLEFRVFESMNGVSEYLRELGDFVVKPDGLTGGKGVKVSGVHLQSIRDALDYCSELLQVKGAKVVIEEKLDGEEFSLQSFCDGTTVRDTVVVQDHKRAYEGDTGPNTGGMGSYSCGNHLLPFIDVAMLETASTVNREIAQALERETGEKYKGILFGGFMATRKGVKLLEYNARFGDPEALNVLSILEGDLCDIFEGIIEGRLDDVPFRFQSLSSVCKYVVPENYPDTSHRTEIDLSGLFEMQAEIASRQTNQSLRVYLAAVDEDTKSGKYYSIGSRAVACVGIAPTLVEAEQIAEAAASSVPGPFRHRRDIGTKELIDRRVVHMEAVLGHSPERAVARAS